MDNISELIKEARPLYKTIKRRKTMAKIVIIFSIPMFLFSSILQIYIQGSDIYVALKDKTLQQELLEDDLGLLR